MIDFKSKSANVEVDKVIALKTEKYSKSSLIYSPLSTQSKVFKIKSGYIFAFTFEDNGKKRIHLIYGPGNYFPVITTFKQAKQRASYEALTDVVLETSSREDFSKRLNTDLDFCREVLGSTVDQLAIFADRVIDLQISNLEDRLLTRLKSLLKFSGQDSDVLPYSLKHHHLADMLGVERESVTRALARLKRKHKVALLADGRLQITDK